MKLSHFAMSATKLLVDERPDVAHLWAFSGLNWASALRRMIDLPYLIHFMTFRHNFPWRIDRYLFRRAVEGADRRVALTPRGAEAVTERYGLPCGVLPPPVDMDFFRPSADRHTRNPVVLFPSDLADPRKGGALMLRAWTKVHAERPDALLALAGPFGLAGFNQTRHHAQTMLGRLDLVEDSRARDAIHIRGPGDPADLPVWYSQASVTVLPSVEEAFGSVITESLSCGTPVVASAHGGPGEILANDEVGVTVDLKTYEDLESSNSAEALADAILRGIELSSRPGTRGACREWASQWGLDRIGPIEEQLLLEIVGEFAPARRSRRRRHAAA